MGRYTEPLSSPGSLTAYSTYAELPCLVATLASYCSCESICSSIAPSCISPRTPRDLTFESTFLRSPTPMAKVCISPRPLYTCSSRSLTILKDWPIRSLSVFSSFSSTVALICSSFLLLSSCMEVKRFSTVVLMLSSLISFCTANSAIRLSTDVSISCTVFCSVS